MVAWGSIIRHASSPASSPSGMGGDINTIWHCSNYSDRVYECSTTDFSVIRSQVSPDTGPRGIGGSADVIYHGDSDADRLYELDPSDFSIVHIQISHDWLPEGIGGDTEYVWHCDRGAKEIYELNTNLSIIRSVSSPGVKPTAIGGKYNKIWHMDNDTYRLYELASDLSIIRSTYQYKYGDAITDVGGDSNVIWSCASNSNKLYERSVGTPVSYVITGNVKNHVGDNLNNVSIEIKNGTDYSVLTNINGNYLQTITPDTYNVTASKEGYPSQHASVNATASDQTQDFVLPCIQRPLAISRRTVQHKKITTKRKISPPRLLDNMC